MALSTLAERSVRTLDPETRRWSGKRLPLLEGHALRQHLQSQYQRSDTQAVRKWLQEHNVPLTEVWEALGYPPERLARTQVRELLTNDNLRPWFGPVIEDGIRLGIMDLAEQWQSLIGTTVDVAGQLSAEYYLLANPLTAGGYELELVGQGADIPVATVSLLTERIRVTKKGRGIAWVDEAKAAPVSIMTLFLQVLGMRMARSYWYNLADRLKLGYLDDGSDAPTTVRTATTGVITLRDLLISKDKLEQDQGYPATDIMANANTINDILVMTWGTAGAGGPVFADGDIAKYFGLSGGMHRNNRLADHEVIWLNRTAALARYVASEFSTEDTRVAQKQIEATFASVTDEVVPQIKEARVLLDGDW